MGDGNTVIYQSTEVIFLYFHYIDILKIPLCFTSSTHTYTLIIKVIKLEKQQHTHWIIEKRSRSEMAYKYFSRMIHVLCYTHRLICKHQSLNTKYTPTELYYSFSSQMPWFFFSYCTSEMWSSPKTKAMGQKDIFTFCKSCRSMHVCWELQQLGQAFLSPLIMWPSHDRIGSKIIHLMVLVKVMELLSELACIAMKFEYIGSVGVEVEACVIL